MAEDGQAMEVVKHSESATHKPPVPQLQGDGTWGTAELDR
jgi:hypothetical protein